MLEQAALGSDTEGVDGSLPFAYERSFGDLALWRWFWFRWAVEVPSNQKNPQVARRFEHLDPVGEQTNRVKVPPPLSPERRTDPVTGEVAPGRNTLRRPKRIRNGVAQYLQVSSRGRHTVVSKSFPLARKQYRGARGPAHHNPIQGPHRDGYVTGGVGRVWLRGLRAAFQELPLPRPTATRSS